MSKTVSTDRAFVLSRAPFAIALVSARSVGVTIRAQNMDAAFEVAENYLQGRHLDHR
jgi:hypothetical protein